MKISMKLRDFSQELYNHNFGVEKYYLKIKYLFIHKIVIKGI